MSADDVGSTPEPDTRVAIGLSFGNTNSSIAYTTASEGKAEVIANEEGDRQIPSILSYVAGEEYTGTQAKSQIVRNPRNTVAFFRDFLGKGFKDVDPSACHASAHPVEIEGGKGVGFTVEQQDGEDGVAEKRTLSVSDITTRHLLRLKNSASDFLGQNVTAAVMTVPSDFSDSQKSALASAAKAAGLEILQFLPDPVSALLAQDAKLQQNGEATPQQQDRNIVVADLGGTRSDVSIVASRGGMYTTLSTAHDYDLGGSTLDKVLIEYAAKEFLKKHKTAQDPRTNERSLAKLTLEAESVKKSLSLGASASFSVESLSDGIDFSLSVNRTRYELLASKALASFTRLIESAVQKADLDVLDIDTILLSGGTSHTPKIASNLRSHFPESVNVIAPVTSTTAINPSELSARGAAVQASLVREFESEEIEKSTEAVVTVTSHLSKAIGLVTGADGFETIVEAETPVPVRRTAQISVPDGGDVAVRLAEGVREIDISKAEPAPKTNGATSGDEDDEDDDDSDEEPEEIRTKVYKPGTVLAEAGVKGVKKGGKVEVQVNVDASMGVTVVVREVGGKGGVRGVIEGVNSLNGSAS